MSISWPDLIEGSRDALVMFGLGRVRRNGLGTATIADSWNAHAQDSRVTGDTFLMQLFGFGKEEKIVAELRMTLGDAGMIWIVLLLALND